MCGLYFIETDEDIIEMKIILDGIRKHYHNSETLFAFAPGEVRPANLAPVIANSRYLKPRPFLMKWGFSRLDHKSLIINARSESAMDKPIFQRSMLQRRCLIPASYYFEWEHKEKEKTKYKIRPACFPMFYMAGIYRYEAQSLLPAFTILTRSPISEIAFIHNRMPVILGKEEQQIWLSQNTELSPSFFNADLAMQYENAD